MDSPPSSSRRKIVATIATACSISIAGCNSLLTPTEQPEETQNTSEQQPQEETPESPEENTTNSAEETEETVEPPAYPDGYAKAGIVSPEIALNTARETLYNSPITYTITRTRRSIETATPEMWETTYIRHPEESTATLQKTTPTESWAIVGDGQQVTYNNTTSNIGSEQAAVSITIDAVIADLEQLITTIAYQLDRTSKTDIPWSPYETVVEYAPTVVTDSLAYPELEGPLELTGTLGVAPDGLPTAQTSISITGPIVSEEISIETSTPDKI